MDKFVFRPTIYCAECGSALLYVHSQGLDQHPPHFVHNEMMKCSMAGKRFKAPYIALEPW